MQKILFCFFALITSGLFGQYLTDIPTKENTVLWKIEGKKLKTESYIFGTIHIVEKAQFHFPESLKKLVTKSDQIALEVADLNQNTALQHMILPTGSMFDFFTAEQKDSVITWGAGLLQMDKKQFELAFGRMKPFTLIQLSVAPSMADMESYDLSIQNLALENNLPVLGLETLADQMKIFDNMDTLDMRNMVMSGIREPEKSAKQLQELLKLYSEKNIDKMYSYTMESEEHQEVKKYQEQLLDNRNRNWIPIIEKMIKKKNTFIAVGAAHLGGPNGVLRLLEQKGYRLVPIHL